MFLILCLYLSAPVRVSVTGRSVRVQALSSVSFCPSFCPPCPPRPLLFSLPLKSVSQRSSSSCAVFLAFEQTTDSALLGHVGKRYLDASSYSDLWTQASGVFVSGRVLGILASQAFGAGNQGVYLCGCVCVCVCVCVCMCLVV